MARMMSYAYATLTFGLALAIGLVAWQGLDAVAAVLAVGHRFKKSQNTTVLCLLNHSSTCG